MDADGEDAASGSCLLDDLEDVGCLLVSVMDLMAVVSS